MGSARARALAVSLRQHKVTKKLKNPNRNCYREANCCFLEFPFFEANLEQIWGKFGAN